MTVRPIVFLDTETLGLHSRSPIWEVAAIRIEPGVDFAKTYQRFVLHDQTMVDPDLPESFLDDYRSRFDLSKAIHPDLIRQDLDYMLQDQPLLAGSNPDFDARLLTYQGFVRDYPNQPWHYHTLDVTTLAQGFMAGQRGPFSRWDTVGKMKADELSKACGVDPADFDRHTAMGDCQWAHALWTAIQEG